MPNFIYLDHAATTPCCSEAMQEIERFTKDCYANPSSNYAFGQKAARAIDDARAFFAERFHVQPQQVIFTGSGTESDNLALYGVALANLARSHTPPGRIIISAIEHPAVKKTAISLQSLGFDVQVAPVDELGQISLSRFEALLTPATLLVSIMRVNNIVGAIQPIEHLAQLTKSKAPGAIFHSDAIQAFGKTELPTSGSAVDLISLSAHKIQGPKAMGALILLNSELVKTKRIQPLIWGGGQEHGLRSGTPHAGLIAGFHIAAKRALERQSLFLKHTSILRQTLRRELQQFPLVLWNSPESALPSIVSLSIPGFPSGQIARQLENKGFLISTGSACSSHQHEPDATLIAMGFAQPVCQSMIRVSFSESNPLSDASDFAQALKESLTSISAFLAKK